MGMARQTRTTGPEGAKGGLGAMKRWMPLVAALLLIAVAVGAFLAMAPGGGLLSTAGRDAGQYGAARFRGKRMSILGDSLSTFGGSAEDPNGERFSQPGNLYTYPGNKCRYPQASLGVVDPHQTYWMRVIDHFGMELGINDSIAGSLVSWDGKEESKTAGADRHIASQARIDHLGQNGAPDIILVNAGTNDVRLQVALGEVDRSDVGEVENCDALPVGDFSSAYRTMLLRLMRTYPDARIVCLTPNFARYDVGTLDAYCDRIREICDLLGVACIDTRLCGITPANKARYLGDGLHYNLEGSEMLANHIITRMLCDIPMG